MKHFSNVVGFDDAPFARDHAGPVAVVGAVYAGLRFDGVLMGEIQKDGTDAADVLATLITESRFADHIRLILLQGIALGGFNVVDVFSLHQRTGLPVLVVSRVRPDMEAIKKALLASIPEGKKKWAVIERLGQMEEVADIFVQRVDISMEQARQVIKRFAVHSRIPEPIRAAHLIAGALANGQSRGNP
ncbi:endonuclease dU [Desulfosudis oleivorans]|uniref:Uncharacterized protein n=1 Tax=Desulfosudis oleivorans (strain DSM 6200 / JCM 39069 / Hxd3) TaxID=96561 RepID=A8ZVG7_DESOH|nr:DUF99 family protein [Desulfosudis oleivorans]ABW68154.1 protein of unknown function DUF99 [Desulfosudis oleivorans Hxd3]